MEVVYKPLEVPVLRIDGKRVPKAVLSQIFQEQIIDLATGKLKGQPLGVINYDYGDWETDGLAGETNFQQEVEIGCGRHAYVLWRKNGAIRRSAVWNEPSSDLLDANFRSRRDNLIEALFLLHALDPAKFEIKRAEDEAEASCGEYEVDGVDIYIKPSHENMCDSYRVSVAELWQWSTDRKARAALLTDFIREVESHNKDPETDDFFDNRKRDDKLLKRFFFYGRDRTEFFSDWYKEFGNPGCDEDFERLFRAMVVAKIREKLSDLEIAEGVDPRFIMTQINNLNEADEQFLAAWETSWREISSLPQIFLGV